MNSFVIFLLVALQVHAFTSRRQTSPTFPACSIICYEDSPEGDCLSTDTACLCQNEEYLDAVSTCLQIACSGSDLETAIEDGELSCEEAGVTLSNSATSSFTFTGGFTSAGTSSSDGGFNSGSGAGSFTTPTTAFGSSPTSSSGSGSGSDSGSTDSIPIVSEPPANTNTNGDSAPGSPTQTGSGSSPSGLGGLTKGNGAFTVQAPFCSILAVVCAGALFSAL